MSQKVELGIVDGILRWLWPLCFLLKASFVYKRLPAQIRILYGSYKTDLEGPIYQW